jgi:Uma2 family endonuclease
MGSTKTALTPAELPNLPRPRNGRHYELSEGELIVVGNAGTRHELVKRRILKALFAYEIRYSTGAAFAESQFSLGDATARIPDAAFLQNAKVALLPDDNGPIPVAPDLAVEVISDSESAADAEKKVGEYLRAGCLEVWQVYPNERRVRVRTAAGIRDFSADESLTSLVLPGFNVQAGSFFGIN